MLIPGLLLLANSWMLSCFLVPVFLAKLERVFKQVSFIVRAQAFMHLSVAPFTCKAELGLA